MASGSTQDFGFELMMKIVDHQLTKKEDTIILFSHWYLIKVGYRCIGPGDKKTLEDDEVGSELLPDDWSKDDHYSLRYVKDNKLYILIGLKSDHNLILNFMRVADNVVTNVKYPVDETVSCVKGPLSTLMPELKAVTETLQKELLDPFDNKTQDSARETSTQTVPTPEQPRYQADPPSRRLTERNPWHPPGDLRGVGRRDLDPFGRPLGEPPGSGMIYDPFEPSRHGFDPIRPGGIGGPQLPRGAVPPGARFDPFGPPDDDMRSVRNPNPDHFAPPGYDDMFM
ncbi:hypothetical protein HCN44_011300 [Aphidius gifuensis]|uniref:Proteasome inhibitor PI31 subunit n=1 Tax=Aphidius gifuensis TaxID=684658 RepID=A0A834XWD0_APHGI|nr:proteasome inhibitor PI31 subunit [Aphidius gifuensis]KAF7994031.1 hypothetical protein HCN44_011300 [Aphidius gifuensis]